MFSRTKVRPGGEEKAFDSKEDPVMPPKITIRSILNDPESHPLGHRLVAEYVEATASEMEADPVTFLPHIEGYASFPGAFAPDGDFLVAEVNGVEAGCVGIKPMSTPGVCEMKTLWVRAANRGQGVARALVEASLGRARDLGFSVMELDVLRSRLGAIELYRSSGFQEGPPHHEYSFEAIGFQKTLR